MSDRDELQLAVMKRALSQIATYIEDLDEDAFLSRRMAVDAVAINLLVVGEAANKLSEPLKVQIPAPWREIIAMRHYIAHDYFGMAADRSWLAASQSAPELLLMVDRWNAA